MARGLNVFVNIGAKVAGSVNASASAVERRFAQMGRTIRLSSATAKAEIASVEKRFGKFSRNFQDFAYHASLPVAGVLAMGGKTAYEFEKIGNELQGISEMSDKARKSIEDIARAMPGRATENLGAAVDLARTGFEAPAIAGSLPTVVKLAKSERGMDTEKASDIASNVMVGMRLFNNDMSQKEVEQQFAKVADRIAFGAAKSSSDIRLMGDSFKYAGPLASRLGNDMDHLTAAFMAMADAGIKGSESGIAVRSMMVRMLRPTKAGAATLERLGIDRNRFVSTGRATSAGDVVKTLKAQGINAGGQEAAISALLKSGLSGADLTSRITDIVSKGVGGAMDKDKISDGVMNALVAGADKADMFGLIKAMIEKGATTADILQFVDTRQGARLMTLFGKDKDGKTVLDSKLAEVKKGAPGFLDRQYGQATKGIVGSFLRLQRSLDNLIITAARSGVIDTVARVFERLASGMDKMSKTNPGLLKFMVYAAMGVAVLGPLGLLLGGVASGIRLIGASATLLARGAVGLAGHLLGIGGAVGKMGPQIPLMLRINGAMRLLAGAGMRALAVGAVELAIAFWPITLAVAAIGVALAFLISKWDGVKAFFAGIGEGFSKSISPETRAAMVAFGDAIGSVFSAIGSALSPVVDAFKAVWDWLAKIFAPANVPAWQKAGQGFGSVLGGMVNGLVGFITKISEAIGKVRELFSLSATGPAGAAVPAAGGFPTRVGARAAGGPVSAGSWYRINEKGQEFFSPGQSGRIINSRASAALFSANGNAPAAANSNGLVWQGDLVVHGANDPQSTRRIVREEFQRLASAQRGGLND